MSPRPNWWRFWPLLAVVAVLIAGGLFLPVFGRPIISLVQTTKTVAAVDVLDEMRDLLQFNTVQYVYKVVFPYDFLKPGISQASIDAKLGSDIFAVPQKMLAMLNNPSS